MRLFRLRSVFTALRYMVLTVLHWFSRQRLVRVPEPHRLTEDSQHVDEYSRALDSIMVLPYVLVLDLVQRLVDGKTGKRAVDLCCGPGHFTRMLAKEGSYAQVVGVDLSEPMLDRAREMADAERLSAEMLYLKSDVTAVEAIDTHSADLVSFMDAAHHMSSLEDVTQVLKEADRVAKPDGLIVLIDPVRPRTAATAALYQRISGRPYEELGLTSFNQDFRDSLFASWTPAELFGAVPRETKRHWVHLVPWTFPAFQILVGLPPGKEHALDRGWRPPAWIDRLIPPPYRTDWEMLRFSFQGARRNKRPAARF